MMSRNISLDVVKIVMAFLVVCLHIPFPGEFGSYVNIIARIAVPCFFVISGFFSYQVESLDKDALKIKRKNRIKKLLIYVIGFDLFYAILFIVRYYDGFETINNLLETVLNPKFLLFNFSLAGHIWYVRALLYIEILLLFTECWLKRISLLPFIGTIWLGDVILCKYSKVLWGWEIQADLREAITKFIGVALVYYFLGWQMKKDSKTITGWMKNVPKNTLFAGLGTCILLNYIEAYLLNYYNVNLMPVNYIMTFWIVVIIMVLAIQYRAFDNYKTIANIACNHSDKVYFYHPFIIVVLSVICNNMAFGKIIKLMILNPITVFFSTIGLSCIINNFSKYRKRMRSA